MSLNNKGLGIFPATDFARLAMGGLTRASSAASLCGSMSALTDRLAGPTSAVGTLMDSARSMHEMIRPRDFRSALEKVASPRDLLGTTYDFTSVADNLVPSRRAISSMALVPMSKMGETLGHLGERVDPLGEMTKSVGHLGRAALETASSFDHRRFFGREHAIAGLGATAYAPELVGRALVDTPLLEHVITPTPRRRPNRTKPLTFHPEARCFLCDKPLVCADARVAIEDHELLGHFSVMPCPTCVLRIVQNPRYMLDRLRELAKSPRRQLRSVEGDRQGDGIARGRGNLRVVPPPKDEPSNPEE